ncbi:hypothetical protein BH09PSE3_BH09PSE3_00250 [soil metagenome]
MTIDGKTDDPEAKPKDMISVILGRVSTEDGDRVLEMIAAFMAGDIECPFEIIIADRIQDGVSKTIAVNYPAVRLIPCTSTMSLPEMRALAFESSQGTLIAVTEDHCVPTFGWLNIASRAFEGAGADLAAVGGCVQNGVTETGFDWATFLCEYSFFSPPVTEGNSQILPGMNVIYRRRALESVPRAALNEGFWETTVHPLLLYAGARFVSLNALKMYHCKKFSVGLFLKQRFLYSRYYAGIRFKPEQRGKRLTATVATCLLPPLLLWRMIGSARAKGLGREFVSALPGLALMVIIWSVGEGYGYLAGPGDALARIE